MKRLINIIGIWSLLSIGSFIYAQDEIAIDTSITSAEYALGTGIRDFTRFPDGSLPHNVGTYGYARYVSPIDTTVSRIEDKI